MAFVSPVVDRLDLGSGRFVDQISLRPAAYDAGPGFQPIDPTWQDSGDPDFPHLVTAASLWTSCGPAGERRIHPTREAGAYIEIGRLYHNPAGLWIVAPMNTLVRNGPILVSTNASYVLTITMIGHGLKFNLATLAGFWPVGSVVAFPVQLVGLTRGGNTFFKNSQPVAEIQTPVVYDSGDPTKQLTVGVSFGSFGSQTGVLLALPSLVELAAAGILSPVIDPTIVIQPDATDGLDTMLLDDQPNTNFGSSLFLDVGEVAGSVSVRRSLIKFDLASMPGNANLTAVTLSLRCALDMSSNARTFRVFRQKRAWVESQATWNVYSSGHSWQAAGGFGANDCEQTDIGSRAFTASETAGVFKDFSLTPGSGGVQDMIPGGSWTNNGFLIKADTEADDAYRFDPSDNATPANRPKLTVSYSLPVAANTGLRSGIAVAV